MLDNLPTDEEVTRGNLVLQTDTENSMEKRRVSLKENDNKKRTYTQNQKTAEISNTDNE